MGQRLAEGAHRRAGLGVAHGGGEDGVRAIVCRGRRIGEEDQARQLQAHGLVILQVGHRFGLPGGHMAVAPGDQQDEDIGAGDLVGRDLRVASPSCAPKSSMMTGCWSIWRMAAATRARWPARSTEVQLMKMR